MLSPRTVAALVLLVLSIGVVRAEEKRVPVRVRVVLFDGAPLGQARVVVRRYRRDTYEPMWPGAGADTIEQWLEANRSVVDAPVVATGTTDANGWVQFDALPTGVFGITSHVPGRAVRGAQVLVPPVRGAPPPTILLDAGNTLQGRVVGTNAAALAGTLVVATYPSAGTTRWDDNERPLAEVADANGVFEIRGVPDGTVSIQACPPGTWFDRRHLVRVPQREPAEVILPVRPLRAVVRDSRTGNPVPDATVLFATSGFHMSNTLVRATTDAEGRLRAGVPSRWLGKGEIRAPGYRLPLRLGADAENPPDLDHLGGAIVGLLAKRSAPLRGRVHDPAGPVAGAIVEATWLTGLETESDYTHSRADGSFELGVRPGLVHLAASRPGPRPENNDLDVLLATGKEGEQGLVDVPLPGRADLQIRLPRRAPAGRVTGRVVTEAGAPVSTGVSIVGSDRRGARTSPSGNFELEAVAPGEVRLQVRVYGRGGAKTIASGPISVRDDETSGGVEIVVPASFATRTVRVEGRVVCREPGIVRLVDRNSRRRYPVAADCSFAFDARVGRIDGPEDGGEETFYDGVEIEAVGPKGWSAEAVAKYVKGQAVRLGDLVLNRPDSVKFRVIAANGARLIEGATVHLTRKLAGPIGCGSFEVPTDLRSRRADGKGWFSVEVPRRGEWILEVRADGWSGRDVSVGDAPPAIVLKPLATLAGKVRFADGTPAAGQRVEIWTSFSSDAPSDRRSMLTDESGRFRFDGLAAATYWVFVESAPGAASIAKVRPDDVAAPNEKLDIVVKHAPAISGRVLDVAGDPIAGVEVRADAEQGQAADHLEARTDARGLFRLAGAESGRHTLTVVRDMRHVDATQEGVFAGAEDLVLRADWGHRITGRLVDGAGRPRAGWVVGAYRPKEDPLPARSVRADKQGRFVLGDLAGGEWVLRIGRYGHHEAASGGKVHAGAEDVTLVME